MNIYCCSSVEDPLENYAHFMLTIILGIKATLTLQPIIADVKRISWNDKLSDSG